MRFILATKNAKKLAEMERILAPIGIDVINEERSGFDFPEVVEDGETFLDNAFLKARSVSKISGMPAIADDSGLCVDALDGAPGVFSARYAGEHGDDGANNALLLKNMENLPKGKRGAHFACAIAVVFPCGEEISAQGICEGAIGYSEQGENGFGYDPLFMVGERSFAQLSKEEKDKISHRGVAMRELAEKLTNRSKRT